MGMYGHPNSGSAKRILTALEGLQDDSRPTRTHTLFTGLTLGIHTDCSHTCNEP
jgi:hypothetical protein